MTPHIEKSPTRQDRPMTILGLMSGTSADGIDAALVRIEDREPLQWSLLGFHCVPWEAELRAAILDACRPDAPLQVLTALNFRLGAEFAKAAKAAVALAGTTLSDVDAVASHGQTVWHQPVPFPIAGEHVTGTMQLGEPSVIAAQTGCVVVADFRTADMAVGGQGAPLVPFADYRLFAHPTETRAVQNIGGIANVCYLPAGGKIGDIVAFDTGPGNMVLDALTQRLTAGKQRYDRDGALAAAGHVHMPLLTELLTHSYFALPPPKSTGREEFGETFTARCRERAETLGIAQRDLLATLTAFTAATIARAYRNFLLPRGPIETVICGGGGVHNVTLMGHLRRELAPARVTTHSEFGVPDDAKEAIAFALLAYETLHDRPSNVPAATGATRSAILGKIVLPPDGGFLRR